MTPGEASGGSVSRADPAGLSRSLPVDRVGVVGLGLMGGSLARALKAADPSLRVVGLSADRDDGERARAAGAVDEVLPDPAGLEAADLVVYAVPLAAFVDLLPRHAPALETCTVTDVGSLKVPVVEAVRRQGLEDRFVGGHPMTGGEGSGFGAARPGLYRGATVHLTRDTGSEEARRRVERFWSALGARPVWVDATVHDRRMVWASHLPQLVATALARSLEGADVAPEELGPGGRDMTRLAASPSGMWRDLVRYAAGLDAGALRVMIGELEALAGMLEKGHFDRLENLMDATRRWRRGGSEG